MKTPFWRMGLVSLCAMTSAVLTLSQAVTPKSMLWNYDERYDEPISCNNLSIATLTGHSDLTGSNWMKDIPDNAYVSELSIPGTHDTATGYKVSEVTFSQTQYQTMEQQFAQGIRAIDLRPLWYNRGNLIKKDYRVICSHGSSHTDLDFSEAFDKINTFLTDHPTEFIIVHLFQLASNVDKDMFGPLNTLFGSHALHSKMIEFRPDLTVGQMRGKVLFMTRLPNLDLATKCSNFKGGEFEEWTDDVKWFNQKGCKINSVPTNPENVTMATVEDISKLNELSDLHAKQEDVVNIMNFHDGRVTGNRAQEIWSFTFMTADADGGYHSYYYAETARNVNPWLINWLVAPSQSSYGFTQNHHAPTGIVYMDWLGQNDKTEKKIPHTSGVDKTDITTFSATLVKRLIQNNYLVSLPYLRAQEVPSGYTDWTSQVGNADMSRKAAGNAPLSWNDATGFTNWVPGTTEQYNKTFDTYQVIPDPGAGDYILSANAFYRQGDTSTAFAAWQNDSENSANFPVLYIEEVNVPSQSKARAVSGASVSQPVKSLYDMPDMQGASSWQNIVADNLWHANADLNGEQFYQVQTPVLHHAGGDLRIGIRKTAAQPSDWTAFSNFRLFRDDYTSGIENVATDQIETFDPEAIVNVYTMQGQLLRQGMKAAEATQGLPTGLYIAGSRKVVVR